MVIDRESVNNLYIGEGLVIYMKSLYESPPLHDLGTRDTLTDLQIYKSIIFIVVPVFLIYKSINLRFFRLTEAGQGSPVDLQIYESIVFIVVPAFCIYEFINL